VFASRSQPETRQDVFAAEFFHEKRGGYFVDVGAFDGVHFSNSVQLERELGWSGVCVEALPSAFSRLRAQRSCTCVQAAAYSEGGLERDFATADVLSGLVRHIDRHEDALHGGRVTVRTETLAAILDVACAPEWIDYLSIDTEGSELDVLRGINFARRTFGLISIEHNFVEPRRTSMRRFLAERGYLHLRENHWDDDYCHASLFPKG
jgi:FkbM family methyltransferase